MNQNLNEEIIIHAKLRDNPQCITLEFKSRYSEQISEVFERGFEGFRKRINQEIFLPKNKSLFILTNETGLEYNLAESVGEKDGLQINNNISLAIENQFIEASIEELQLTNVIKEETSDFIRKFAKTTIDFTKKVSKAKIFLNTVGNVCRGLRVLKIFASNLKLISKLSQGIKFFELASSIIGLLALALDIGYLIYYRKKFSNSMFYKRIGAVVGKSVLGVQAYCEGYKVGGYIGGKFEGAIAASAGMPTLMPIILGVIFGSAFAFITEYGLEKLLNYFWNDDQQICNDINFLNDYDKNKCYFSALEIIGCEEKTLTSEIKKKRIQKLKELHPNIQNDKIDEFKKQYVAFDIVLSFRKK